MRLRQLLIILFVTLFAVGCFKKKGPTRAARVAAFIENAWEDFDASSPALALADFLEALELDEDNLEARLGAGWSLILLDDDDLTSPRVYLDSTVTASTIYQLDAWTGLATIALTDRRYPDSDSLSALVLVIDSSYIFTRLTSVDWRDLQLFQGQARFAQSLYDSSWLAVEDLISDTPFSSVTRTDTTTWVTATSTKPFVYFPEILALILSYLSDLFGEG